MAFGYVTPYRRPMMRASGSWSGSNALFDLNRQINRLFDDLFDWNDDDERDGETASRRSLRSPLMDVSESDDGFEITAELPGVREDDVELTVQDGVLTLRGEKRRVRESNDKSDNSGWSERSYGSFERRIALPANIDEDKIDAEFADGVLTIALPTAAEKDSGRRIELRKRDERREGRLVDDDGTKVEENA